MLTPHILQEFIQQIEMEKKNLEVARFDSRLHHLEARYTLFGLQQLLAAPHRNIEKEIISFLSFRWKRVQDSDVQYLHDFTNPANRACISIARKLGQLLGRPYLTLLMPSLLAVDITSYITCNYTEELNFHELIISDCNQRLISLPDVLDFANEDGLLRHNTLFQGQQRLLTVAEKERFLSRHSIIRETYEALNARATYKYHGDTLGAALKRLIEGLREGGRRALGADFEFDSGAAANVAILVFNEYLETLDTDVKDQLMRASKFDRYDFYHEPQWLTVETLWNRLARPLETSVLEAPIAVPVNPLALLDDPIIMEEGPIVLPENPLGQLEVQPITPPQNLEYRQINYCVELTASKLEDILNENPFLYDLMSYQGSAPQNIASLNEAVNVAREAVNDSLALLQKHCYYGLAGDKKLCSKLLLQIEQENNRQFSFHMNDITYLTRQYNMGCTQRESGIKKGVIARTLRYLTATYPARYITESLADLSSEERQPFMHVTGFNPHPYRFQHTRATFWGSRDSRKRKTEDAGEDERATHTYGRMG